MDSFGLNSPNAYPEAVAAEILSLKQLYPPIHYHEIVRIIERKFGYKTNHHTVKSFLDRHPIPVQLELDFTSFRDFEDAYQARWTVVRMHAQGWNKRSIAACLKLSPQHVHDLIDAFEQDGFAGLEDHRTRPINHPANQLTLPFLKKVLDIQQTYPRAGKFRVRGLLEKQYQEQARDEPLPSESTVSRAMALNRQFHQAPGPWQSQRDEVEPDKSSKFRLSFSTRLILHPNLLPPTGDNMPTPASASKQDYQFGQLSYATLGACID